METIELKTSDGYEKFDVGYRITISGKECALLMSQKDGEIYACEVIPKQGGTGHTYQALGDNDPLAVKIYRSYNDWYERTYGKKNTKKLKSFDFGKAVKATASVVRLILGIVISVALILVGALLNISALTSGYNNGSTIINVIIGIVALIGGIALLIRVIKKFKNR